MPTETITDSLDAALDGAGFRWLTNESGVRALSSRALDAAGFANAFSTRLGGCSPFPANDLNLAGFDEDTAENIGENRRRFLSLLGGDWTLATCWQVHGTNIRIVRETKESPEPPESQESQELKGLGDDERCDALMTGLPRVLVGVKTADCVPVVLGDRRTGACAAVHAGWRGTSQSIVARALARMSAEYGTRACDLIAAIGPAALRCCYEVGAEVVEIFKANFPADSDALFTPTRAGHALVDLHEANRRQLVGAGVAVENIHAAPLCTMCRTDLFFSYRREKRLRGRTGRLLGVIGRRETRRA